MASKKVQIEIDTKATGNGAKQAADGLQKVGAESEKTTKRRVAAEERAALKAEQAAKKSADAVIREERRKTAAAEAGAAKRVKAEERAQTQAAQASAKAANRRSQLAGQVGLQVQDIAVQAQMGVKATTILAQQGSQLLGAFGPQGAIIGGVIAIGAAAYGVFTEMAKNAAVTGEAMEDMSDKLKEAFSASATKTIDDFNTQLQQSTEFAQTLRDAELQLKEARDQRAASDARLIDSQLKLDEASIKYLESTGQIVNSEEELLAVRQKAAEATKNAQIAETNAEVERQRALYKNIVDQRKDVDAEVQDAKKKLAQLEAQQAKIVPMRSFYANKDKELIKAGVYEEGFQSARTVEATGQLDSIQKQIENLYKIIEDKPQRMQEIANEAMAQAANVDAAIITAEIQIDEINTKYNLTQRAQELTTATDQIKTGAEEIGATIAGFTPLNEQQNQAKATIQKALEDGKITVQESQQIGGSLQMLMSNLQAGQGVNLSTLQDLVKLNSDMLLKMQQLNKETSALRTQMSALQGTR